jgi:hypothetical protein
MRDENKKDIRNPEEISDIYYAAFDSGIVSVMHWGMELCEK